MTFTDKDYEDALRLRRVTGLAWPSPSISSPQYAGGYRMGDHPLGGSITFNLSTKPRWIHRMGVRLVLGWKWVDA